MSGEFDVAWKYMYESAMKKLKKEQERNQRYCRIIRIIFQLNSKEKMDIYEAINKHCKSEDRENVKKKIRNGGSSSELDQILDNVIIANDPFAVTALYPHCTESALSKFGLALREGSLESAISILLSTNDFNLRYAEGNTALHCAAEADSYELTKVLIDLCDINATNNKKETALHLAAKNKSATVSKLLLEAGSSPTAKDEKGLTPIHRAAENGNKKLLSKFIGENKDLCKLKSDKGMTPLTSAFYGLLSFIESSDDQFVEYPICKKPFIKTIKYLISIGSDINTIFESDGKKYTTLQLALFAKDYELVKVVLDAGAPFEKDSLLTLWKGTGGFYIFTFLHFKNDIPNDESQMFKHILAKMEKDMIEISKFLVKCGADVNKGDEENVTPLMWATWLNMQEGVRFLINAGADLKARDADGNTIAHYAAIHNNEEIKKLIGFERAKNATNDKGETPEEFGVDYYKDACLLI